MPYLDAARGLCVLAVVLVHLDYFHTFPLTGDPTGMPVLKAWEILNLTVLAQLRMPLLLLLSGWLAASKVRAGLRSGRTRWAIMRNVHLVVVWTVVYVVVERLVAPGPRSVATAHAESLTGLLREIVLPSFGPLWFVHLLAVCLVVLAAARRLPPALVLTALLLSGWAIERATGDPAGLPRAVFFAAGVYLAPRLPHLVRSRRAVVAAIPAALGFSALYAVAPESVQYPLDVATCLPLALLALAGMAWVTRRPLGLRLSRPLSWVGRRTLGVYVLHWPIVGIIAVTARRHAGDFGWLYHDTALAIAYPLALTALIAAACIALEAGLKRAGLGILFEPPARVQRAVDPASAGAGQSRRGSRATISTVPG